MSNNDIKWSSYQQAIFEWVTNGRGNAIVNAVPGSGKTTTLTQGVAPLIRTSRQTAAFVAFSRDIVKEINRQLEESGANMYAKTCHAFGRAMIAKHLGSTKTIDVDQYKYRGIANTYAEFMIEKPYRYEFAKVAVNLIRHMMLALVEPDDEKELIRLAFYYQILEDIYLGTTGDPKDPPNENGKLLLSVIRAMPALINKGEEQAQAGVINFEEMLWLPIRWDLQSEGHDWVLVDECQDLSPLQLKLVLRLRRSGGRMLFVGDPNQAIFGFAGADSASYQNIIKETGAVELPLSVCYRCPTSHIRLLQGMVPEVTGRDNAPEGSIVTVEAEKVHSVIREGDLILCRTTAPLVKLCIELIALQVPARVKGHDIGRGLVRLVKQIEKNVSQKGVFEFRELPGYLDDYLEKQIYILSQKLDDPAGQIESVSDRVACIQTCYSSMVPDSLEEFCQRMGDLFDDKRSSVYLSTVHRAKGAQNDRVLIIRPEQLPLIWQNQTPEQYAQEMNLRYVALSRSKDVLVFVEETKLKDKKGLL